MICLQIWLLPINLGLIEYRMKEVVAADVSHDKIKHFTEESKKETYFRVAKAATRM